MVQRHLTCGRLARAAAHDDGDVAMAVGPAPAAPPAGGFATASGAVGAIREAVQAARFVASASSGPLAAAAHTAGLSVTTPALPSAIALARAVSEESGAAGTPAARADRWALSGLNAADVDGLHAWLHAGGAHASGISTEAFMHLLAALPAAPAPGVSQNVLTRLNGVRDAFVVRNGIPTFAVGVHYNTAKHCLEVSIAACRAFASADPILPSPVQVVVEQQMRPSAAFYGGTLPLRVYERGDDMAGGGGGGSAGAARSAGFSAQETTYPIVVTGVRVAHSIPCTSAKVPLRAHTTRAVATAMLQWQACMDRATVSGTPGALPPSEAEIDEVRAPPDVLPRPAATSTGRSPLRLRSSTTAPSWRWRWTPT